MSPLDALTGEHEEEEGSDHHGNAQLPPQQHGWTDDEWAAAERRDVVELSINQSACYVSIFGLCHLMDVFLCSVISPLSFISINPECVTSCPVNHAAF